MKILLILFLISFEIGAITLNSINTSYPRSVNYTITRESDGATLIVNRVVNGQVTFADGSTVALTSAGYDLPPNKLSSMKIATLRKDAGAALILDFQAENIDLLAASIITASDIDIMLASPSINAMLGLLSLGKFNKAIKVLNPMPVNATWLKQTRKDTYLGKMQVLKDTF